MDEQTYKVRLPYRHGNRPVEKTVAFALTLTIIFWFVWKNRNLSLAAGTGLLDGATASFFIRMLGLHRESIKIALLMVALVLIGLKYGAIASATGFLGSLIFTGFMIGMVLLGSFVLSIFKV